MKEYKNLPLYEFSPSQESTIYQQDFCLHKNVDQVPTYMMTDHKIDWKLMEKAVNVEIERNDCLRIRFIKTRKGRREYFLPEHHLSDIPVDDYRGKTREDMIKGISADAAKPVRLFKGEVFRIRFFYAFDGRCGVYLCSSHMIMDLAAVFIFYKDLFSVYNALENNLELPKPLDSFEESLKRDLEKMHNKDKYAREDAFFVDYFKKQQPSFYAGIDGMRQLNKEREKKKDPNRRYVNIFDPFHDGSANVMRHVDGETIRKITAFAEEQHIPFQSLLYLAYRTHLSKINERTDDVYFHMIVNRRTILKDLNCGGDRMQAQPMRTIIPEDMTFSDALRYCAETQMKIMRYADHPTRRVFDIVDANEHRKVGGNTSTMLFSCLPFIDAFCPPEGWNYEIGGCSTGRFAFPQYTLIIPSLVDGGMDFYYEYQTHRFCEKELVAMHENMLKVLDMGMKDPTITIGQLLDSL